MSALLELHEVTKVFPGVVALDAVSLEVRAGEIHALVGENGAGKSTLVKIVSGVHPPDKGFLRWRGEKVIFSHPSQAQKQGIFAIHQQRQLVPFFSGYENLFVGRTYPQRRGIVSWREVKSTAEKLKKHLGVEIDLSLPASMLTPAERTMVEILRALLVRAALIILDEPTAALSENEVRKLFEIIRQLRERGTSFLYVSHRLEEVFALCDRVTVLRNGRLVKTLETSQTSKSELVAMMAGEEATGVFPPPPVPQKQEVLLSLRQLSTEDRRVKEVTLELYRGEIFGLFGLVGAGRTELLEALYGLRKLARGEVYFQGNRLAVRSPYEAMRAGFALVPEDRIRRGVIPSLSVRENVTLPVIERFRFLPWLPVPERRKEKDFVSRMIRRLQIKAAGTEQMVATLSGGNQQKVVLAKWIARGAQVFLCDEPTQGVDVGARREIYELLYQLIQEGAGILLVSSDLEEVLTISHRVGVMVGGRLIKVLSCQKASSRDILSLCYGTENGKGESGAQ
jgi:ribose transport system ATP-binding protein